MIPTKEKLFFDLLRRIFDEFNANSSNYINRKVKFLDTPSLVYSYKEGLITK